MEARQHRNTATSVRMAGRGAQSDAAREVATNIAIQTQQPPNLGPRRSVGARRYSNKLGSSATQHLSRGVGYVIFPTRGDRPSLLSLIGHPSCRAIRMRPTKRSRTLTPGKSTLFTTSQDVARSIRGPG
jgi:hypothetical protein